MNLKTKYLLIGAVGGCLVATVILRVPNWSSSQSVNVDTGGEAASRHVPADAENDQARNQSRVKVRAIKEREAYLFEIGALRKTPLGEYRLLDHTGSINDFALDKAGIAKADKAAVQALIDDAKKQWEKLVIESSKVQIPEGEQAPRKEGAELRYIVEVSAQTSQGNQILKDLQSSLAQKYGDKAAEILLEGLDDQRPMGGLARQNQRIEITYLKSIDKWNIDWSNINPKTGESIMHGTTKWDRFAEINGNWLVDVLGKDPTVK